MYLEKELENWSVLYSVNIWFLPIIFKEVSWNIFLQLAGMSHLTNLLFIAQSSAGETENINIFCHIVFIERIITTHCVL
jgi:hypothetical protein